MEQFQKLGLCEPILRAIENEQFEKPSEIQEKTIPLVLAGKDVIAGAATGSGKTLVFGSAIIQNTRKDFGIQALVLTPTRELAEQNSRALNKFSKHRPLKIIPVYGGVSINPQIEDLEYADVVIGTPGRILDHISRKTIDLSNLKTLVLDEADRMFDMGFREDVEKIISQCPKNRQTLLFSATISSDIALLAQKHMKNPIEVSAEQYVDPEKLTQVYYDIDDSLKYSLLVHLLKNEKSGLVMVFCNTRKNVDFVAKNLNSFGIDAIPIHGGFSQEKRNRVIANFHSKKSQILVCTDVAARGLDIKGVSHIYNYNLPNDSKEYIHRIGRTARAENEGKVINLLSDRDYENFRNILMDDNLKIKLEPNPEIQRLRISWIPERKSFGRTNSRQFGNRQSYGHRSDGRISNSRGDYSRRSDDRRSDTRRNDNRRDDRRDDRRRNDRRNNFHSRSSSHRSHRF